MSAPDNRCRSIVSAAAAAAARQHGRRRRFTCDSWRRVNKIVYQNVCGGDVTPSTCRPHAQCKLDLPSASMLVCHKVRYVRVCGLRMLGCQSSAQFGTSTRQVSRSIELAACLLLRLRCRRHSSSMDKIESRASNEDNGWHSGFLVKAHYYAEFPFGCASTAPGDPWDADGQHCS